MLAAAGFRAQVERAAQDLTRLSERLANDGLLDCAGPCAAGAQAIRVLWELLAAAERELAPIAADEAPVEP